MTTSSQKVTLEEIEVQIALGAVTAEDLPFLVARLSTSKEVENFVTYLLSNARRKGISLTIPKLITILRAALGNLAATPQAFTSAATHKSARIRTAVASNKNTPHQILELLSNDKRDAVRTAVALNPVTPPSILERLYNVEDNSSVSLAALGNLQATTQMKTDAINKGTMAHLEVVIWNHNNLLSVKGIIEVIFARALPSLTDVEVKGGGLNVLHALLYKINIKKATIDPSILSHYAQHANREVRVLIAGCASTPVDVITNFLRDPAIKVRCKAVHSGKIPMTKLKIHHLIEKSEKVKKAIESRLNKDLKK